MNSNRWPRRTTAWIRFPAAGVALTVLALAGQLAAPFLHPALAAGKSSRAGSAAQLVSASESFSQDLRHHPDTCPHCATISAARHLISAPALQWNCTDSQNHSIILEVLPEVFSRLDLSAGGPRAPPLSS